MEQNQNESSQIGAVRVLVNAVRLAQSRGVFSLEEASLIHDSVKLLTTPPEERAQKYHQDMVSQLPTPPATDAE
jgi:hypothetical protein